VSEPAANPGHGTPHQDPTDPTDPADPADVGSVRTGELDEAVRDIGEVPAVEVITTVAIHLMSAAAVKCGLGEEGARSLDLDEARKLINALAGLVVTAAPDLSTFHAAPLRDGLRSLQLAFREASTHPDPPGRGPGEQLTGPVA
jgi:hypothetical protein